MLSRCKEPLTEIKKTFLITINRCNREEISGVIYYALMQEGHRYSSLIEMVNIIEDYMKEIQYPARCVERRSFKVPADVPDPEALMASVRNRVWPVKPLTVFRIRITHQYRSSWQGTAENTDTGQKTNFQSFLELLMLMGEQLPDLKDWLPVPELDVGCHITRVKNHRFVIKILYKRYGTWQGILYWSDKKKQVNFRSYLEMLLLIEEACGIANSKAKIIDFKSAVGC